MTKVYMMPSSGSFSPLMDDYKKEKPWIERFALRWLKCAVIGLIVTMTFLVITQQLLNQRLTAENERLRQLAHRAQDTELLQHPLFDRYSEEFEQFKRRFKKTYENHHEEHRRKLIFLNRMQEIDQWNDDQTLSDTEFGANEFADMTDEEIRQFLMPVDYYRNLRRHATFIRHVERDFTETAVNVPPRFDWREKGVVTAVKAQGKCGSCWAFATAATVESAYAVAHGELRNLSEQELLDCNLDNNACNGGDLDKSFQFVHEVGLMGEDAYPYVAHRQNSCALAGETTKIDVAYWLHQTEDAIIDWLLTYGPVNVGIAVPPSMMQYKGGVFDPSPYDCKFKVLGLHALLVVGYGTSDEGEKYWIVKNSWGQQWGTENGFVYFVRGKNACGIEDEPIGILA